MSVEFDRGSPGKFDSRTLNRKTLNRWTGRMAAGDLELQPSGGALPPSKAESNSTCKSNN